MEFLDNSPFPKDFKENFLKNSSNKEKLNLYLADKFMEFHNHDSKSFTLKKGNTITTNENTFLGDTSINI